LQCTLSAAPAPPPLARARPRRADCRSVPCRAARDPATPQRGAGLRPRPVVDPRHAGNDAYAHAGRLRGGLARRPDIQSRAPCTAPRLPAVTEPLIAGEYLELGRQVGRHVNPPAAISLLRFAVLEYQRSSVWSTSQRRKRRTFMRTTRLPHAHQQRAVALRSGGVVRSRCARAVVMARASSPRYPAANHGSRPPPGVRRYRHPISLRKIG
jgi:hypothetical protein